MHQLDLNRSYGGGTKSIFGSPSYPSPLDRVRSGRNERAAQLGLCHSFKDSFEANQSFPKAIKPRPIAKHDLDVTTAPVNTEAKRLQDFQGTFSARTFLSFPRKLRCVYTMYFPGLE